MIDSLAVAPVALAVVPMFGLTSWLLTRERVRLTAATVCLAAGMTGVGIVVGAALWTRDPWLLLLAVSMLGLAAVVWPVYRMVRTGRTNWYCRMLTRWALQSRRTQTGARLQTMEQLRAEYGQTVLDDATRDPVLDKLLTQSARRFEAELAAEKSPLPLDTQITLYANGMIEAFTDPPEKIEQIRRQLPADRERRWQFPHYRSYAPFALAIATMCRAHDSARIQPRAVAR